MFPNNFAPPYDNTQVTVELRQLVESGVDVWAFDYPSYYAGAEKEAFEKKVLDHYWLRQIGQETAGRWLHCFRTRIVEIMPYYIQLYESQALMQSIEDPFGNVDVTETFEQETTSESTAETSGSSSGSNDTTTTNDENHIRKFSDTPQGSINNLNDYLTEATVETADDSSSVKTDSETSTEATSSGSESGTVRHTLTRKGNQGVNTYAHDMKELRGTFLNIDLMIINELKDLFLQVY